MTTIIKLAVVENKGKRLHICRLNTSYVADLKNGVKFWLVSLIFFGCLDLLSLIFNRYLLTVGSHPLNSFLTVGQMALLSVLFAIVIAVNLAPDSRLLSPQVFIFDHVKNAFSVDGRYVCSLDDLSIHIQDGFGPSRRAFRLVVMAWGSRYVIAQTQRFTVATLYGKEYSYVVTNEGRQQKYRFNQWADYTGDQTGFSSKWADYQEIFALHSQLAEFVRK